MPPTVRAVAFVAGAAILVAVLAIGQMRRAEGPSAPTVAGGGGPSPRPTRVQVESDGWLLIGDLHLPATDVEGPVPGVLLLNQAAGDRVPYAALAARFADLGIAALALDLRGHGESVNLGAFVPGESRRDPLIWDAEPDVTAALRFLADHPRVAPDRLGVVGASYSGEEAAEAGRMSGYAAAYVLLSPGSFGDESIGAMDDAPSEWLLVAATTDGRLTEIVEEVRTRSRRTEVLLLEGGGHATDMLERHPGLSTRVTAWMALHLGVRSPFATGVDVAAIVRSNRTDCVVDGLCVLELELTDTVVSAAYGLGERPQDECVISREVSDAAFGVAEGDPVAVRMEACGEYGLVLRSVEPRDGRAP